MIRIQLLVTFLLGLAIGCNEKSTSQAEVYDSAIDALALGTQDGTTGDAVRLLESAGVDAFPALLARLDDDSDACDRFMHAVGSFGDGPHEPYHPSIGRACFDLIQGQAEGVWPKGFRQYHVLNNSNIREWIGQRKGKTLHEMRVECANYSLNSAKQKHEQDPTEWTKTCVEFLTENLAKVQNAN
ncbi:hypothetical protein [Mariniblastus fucicola]|uniref:hypothetical protein n=1 Tax=Mariniblastus fucicola TaxID=980251 RepID=UPI0011DF2BC1|nr:hypothetical protein [Mariniblastus fucicola]